VFLPVILPHDATLA